jgi:hypothetical protein
MTSSAKRSARSIDVCGWVKHGVKLATKAITATPEGLGHGGMRRDGEGALMKN